MDARLTFNMYLDNELPAHTDIAWLDAALELAELIMVRIMKEIEERKLPESGNGVVLKTNDT